MEEKKHLVGGISRKTLERLPVYHHYLERRDSEGLVNISAPVIALDLQLNEVHYHKSRPQVFADFLYQNTRLEKGAVEKEKYGFLERENLLS